MIPIDQNTLFPPQSELLAQGFLESRDNWIIVTPTGSGKTRIAEWAISRTIDHGYGAAYIAPLKAILEERMSDWPQRFSDWRVGLFTGESGRKIHGRPTNENLLLFTPEKLAAYLTAWKRNLNWISQLDLLVIDEFHLLGDSHRGSGLESLVLRIKRVNPFIRIIALSATLSNHKELATWLRARCFISNWRPVSIDHRIVRFKKVAEKVELLIGEIQKTIAEGGKVLVFVNSRRRSESICRALQEQGIHSDFNHAGLDAKSRTQTQSEMRLGKLDVLVATSTLEMGVNFPARKVVIYDSYAFDGESFSPLSVQRYLQYAGRAGRPGLDSHGEAVLFLPVWDRHEDSYRNRESEPIKSTLFRTRNLVRELLIEVSGRLSVSEKHLDVNFADRSLWRKQGGQLSVTPHLASLLANGLLKETKKEAHTYLSETYLGRVATQMSLSPETIIFLARVYRAYETLTEFDLLLAANLAEEAQPRLGFNFEEIDNMGDLLLTIPSELLDTNLEQTRNTFPELKEKRILAAIKGAAIIFQHTQGKTLEELASFYDAYPSDLALLKRNICWILSGGKRIFAALWRASLTEEAQGQSVDVGACIHEAIAERLAAMVDYGIPSQAVGLVAVDSIGPKRARLLLNAGISTPQELISRPRELGEILKLKEETIEKILCSATKAIESAKNEGLFDAQEPVVTPRPRVRSPERWGWSSEIDPYRLRRALELIVTHVSAEAVLVAGGTEPHRVTVMEDALRRRAYSCDCADFTKGQPHCKHVILARLELGDDGEILELLQKLQATENQQLRFALGELWMSVCSSYDLFNDRHVDYNGKRFLERARTLAARSR